MFYYEVSSDAFQLQITTTDFSGLCRMVACNMFSSYNRNKLTKCIYLQKCHKILYLENNIEVSFRVKMS